MSDHIDVAAVGYFLVTHYLAVAVQDLAFGVLDEDTKTLNLQAFNNAVASIKKAQASEGGAPAPDAAGYAVPDAKW